MRDDPEARERLSALDRPCGREERDLCLGAFRIRLAGLDVELARRLARRWGGFLEAATAGEPRLAVALFRAGAAGWLPLPAPGELYRIEVRGAPPQRLVLSYSFGLCRERPGRWRLGLTEPAEEPAERALENALRYLAARLALSTGGFALHAAGVLREGRAFVLAGPSGAGKTTAARMALTAASLGDDFAIVVPDGAGWAAAAVPFDNAERVPQDAPRGLFPLAGVWRLRQASETRIETLPASRAVAALLGCVAFPWTMPEAADRLLEQARRYVLTGNFGVLHVSLRGPLWTQLL